MSIIKITLKISGKEIEMSLQEAEQLYRALDDVFSRQSGGSYGPLQPRPQPYVERRWGDYPTPYTPIVTCKVEAP